MSPTEVTEFLQTKVYGFNIQTISDCIFSFDRRDPWNCDVFNCNVRGIHYKELQ